MIPISSENTRRRGGVPALALHLIIATIVVVLCALVRWSLDPWLHDQTPFVIFTPAVMLAASVGGLIPGVWATLLAALIGDYFWVEPSFTLEILHPHEFIHSTVFVIVGIAISALGAALQQARRRAVTSEQHYRAIVETASEGIVILNADGHLEYANARMARMLGCEPQDLIGRPVLQFIEPSARDAAREWLKRARPSAYRGDVPLLRRDGSIMWGLISTTPLSGDERSTPLLAMITDVTEHKLTQQQLQQARDAAEAASSAKDRFLAMLSHELRTPLTPALLALSAYDREQGIPDDLKSDLRMIRRNIELEVRLIDDLLDLTRLSRGKLKMHLEPADAHAILQAAIDIFRDDMTARQIHLSVDFSAPRHRIHADAARLQQVFWNILKNAVKFTPAGGMITVRTFNSDDQPALVQIEITDSGKGIEPELLPRLFQAFEQGGEATTRQYGGLGLGLAISKSLVELHGGTISAHSEGPGRGSTFRISLPAMEQAVMYSGEPGPGLASSHHRPLRILVVEDHADTARSLAAVLRTADHRVETAENMAAALRAVEAESFDLVISDLGLPDGSGQELIRYVRQRQAIPGIALSGYGSEADIKRSREAGFAEHLVKPVDVPTLERAIEKLADSNHPPARAL